MATSEYFISSLCSVTYVNIEAENKIVFLPPASTSQGQTFTIQDISGQCGNPNFIFVSTVGIDKMDNSLTLLTMSSAYQSFRVYAQNLSNYTVLQNNIKGAFWLS